MIDLNVFIDEPADVYHAKAKQFLSSHQLMEFANCPYKYKKRISGLIEDKDSPAYLIGRAAHTRILEGLDVYEREYAVGGPINPSTGKPYGNTTKKFLEWQAEQQKPVLPFDKVDLIEAMNSGVRMSKLATELLSQGRAEGVVRNEYCGIPCQIRVDWAHPEFGIVDLKTCDNIAAFETDTWNYGYRYQLAFYHAVLGTVVPNLPAEVYIIAVEKREPHCCGVWKLTEGLLAESRAANEASIARLKHSHENDFWPTGYETLRLLHQR